MMRKRRRRRRRMKWNMMRKGGIETTARTQTKRARAIGREKTEENNKTLQLLKLRIRKWRMDRMMNEGA